MLVARPPWQGRILFRSRDVDETQAFFDPTGLRFDPIGSYRTLDVRFDVELLSGIYVAFVHFGAAAVVRAAWETAYSVKLPVQGRFEAACHEVVSCAMGQGVVLTPRRENTLRSETGATRLSIALTRDAMTQHLTALLGTVPNVPLEFAAALNMREGHGRSLARFARIAIAELERPDTILREPITARSFREFVTTALLLHQPHNYSERLQRLERPAAPRDVKRAIDYIEANLGAAIGLPEIVAASAVPGRTLIQHFRDFKGTSPMRYLRAARFEKVREALNRAEPEESITHTSSYRNSNLRRHCHSCRGSAARGTPAAPDNALRLAHWARCGQESDGGRRGRGDEEQLAYGHRHPRQQRPHGHAPQAGQHPVWVDSRR